MRTEGSVGSAASTAVRRTETGRGGGGGRGKDGKAMVQRRRRSGEVLVRAGGMRTQVLRVHIERRMSDVQRARHVEVESFAEVRREKRNRDIVGDGADGMR